MLTCADDCCSMRLPLVAFLNPVDCALGYLDEAPFCGNAMIQ